MIDRLFNYLKSKGISDAEFARRIKKTPQQISILKQRGSFGLKFILDTVAEFPEIDLNWLILGEDKQTNVIPRSGVVNEPEAPYTRQKKDSSKDVCKECVIKDKMINSYEKLCESQENTIKRLEAELLSMQEKTKKTG